MVATQRATSPYPYRQGVYLPGLGGSTIAQTLRRHRAPPQPPKRRSSLKLQKLPPRPWKKQLRSLGKRERSLLKRLE